MSREGEFLSAALAYFGEVSLYPSDEPVEDMAERLARRDVLWARALEAYKRYAEQFVPTGEEGELFGPQPKEEP